VATPSESAAARPACFTYERRRPERTTLYEVVRDNLETLYGAVDDGAIPIALPGFVRKELDGYLDCGLLCRGFAHLKCQQCDERRLVAFACKGRGFCPSCTGRRMAATAANLVECVLPEVALRQWVFTFPFPWRKRLAYDGALLGAVTRIAVSTVLGFYRERLRKEGASNGQSGAVVVVQRTSSDLKLHPHLHVLFLDGAYMEDESSVSFTPLPRLSTGEVGEVLQQAVARIAKHLRRGGLLAAQDGADAGDPDGATEADGLSVLAESATSGRSPPAGPEWRRKSTPLSPLAASALHYDKPLCASLDGFSLHAATRAGALDKVGREALCKYVLRPPIAQERVTHGPDGLVRITLKKPFADGTIAVDMDPLSLLSRLAAAVPPPRLHTVRYAGALAPASKLRPKIVPTPADDPPETETSAKPVGSRYRPWAELLKRCFSIDVLACPTCGGRMRLVALVTEAASVRRFLRALGEPTDTPTRAPARGPPYWRSRVLRRAAGEVSVA
jgi:hypothetical protein